MICNKRGITVVSTLIVLVAITAIAATVTFSTNYILENTYKEEFIREYKLVKAATKDYIIRNSGVIDFEETTLDLTTIDSNYLDQFAGEVAVDNVISMYVIDLEKIGIENATYGVKAKGNEDDVYLLSKETNIVYYKQGFESDDKIYYIAIED